ncbi:MAG: M6 family metalloprotease domain-containing protein [Bacteroidales bacterium]|nr:M6 family metalloprotease domain-containing protein [Bacteroidales bacterium]
MKHILKNLLCTLLVAVSFSVQAVYVQKMPVSQIQPSGDTIHFFVTGDECYHRYHDDSNYTIVQDHAGYWVYALPSSEGGIQPSPYRVGTVDPATLGIQPGLQITKSQWLERRRAWDIPEQYRLPQPKTSGRNHGDYCNLVIFIRFADDTAYTRSLASIDQMWSDSSSDNSVSVYNYFKHVSYNKLFVRTYYAPTPDSNTILSYQSPHPRAYFMPYNESNTIGYSNYSERTEREFELLVGAVNYINDSAPVPSQYNLDCDNDGYIDNVNFVVKGSYTGWSDLLWPHKWNLYGHDAYINGKQVNTFNFALEGAGTDYFGPSTFCHEMFHSLGAPDLYRYNEGTGISPVGSWDLMASNSKPPQNMSAYMKYKYGNWLDSVPLITTPGTYTLHSVADSVPGTNIYRFPSADSNQFYVVEYRDNTELFDRTLSGKGLLIYRIDTRFNGNANWNGEDEFDEIWLFRPGSNDSYTDGQIGMAFFSSAIHRTEFSPSTDPYPYLSDGTRDYTFSISNVTTPGSTISFYYTNHIKPANLTHSNITASTATLSWGGNADAYRVSYRLKNSNEPYINKLVRTTHVTITGLSPNELYEWTVRSLYNPIGTNNYADSSSLASSVTLHTELCNNSVQLTIGGLSTNSYTGIPFTTNENYNYSQQLFLSSEIGGEQNISTISLQYAHTTALDKQNCTIYLAHTDINDFNESDSLVPFSQLKQVYTGDLHFTKGWNDIILDSLFHYNGTDNLILAIDDNSNTPSRAGNKFYVQSTDLHMAICYHSTSINPDPKQDTIKGTLSRLRMRNNIKFIGCPIDNEHVYACVISDNDALGQVTGTGLYLPGESITIYAIPTPPNQFQRWNDNNTDNPRTVVLSQDTIFVAYFLSPLGIDSPDQSNNSFVTSSHLCITIQGAPNQPIHIYDLMGRHIASASANHPASTTFQMPNSGVFLVRIGNEKPIKLFVR